MSETCAVCKKGKGPEKCEVCGFSDNGFINRNGQFPIPEDAKNWIETVVKPYRAQWEAKQREAELSAQLEAAKKKEAELIMRLEESKKNVQVPMPISHPQQETFSQTQPTPSIIPKKQTSFTSIKIGTIILLIVFVIIIIYLPSSNTYFKSGNEYYEKKDYDKAIENYSTAIKLKPDNPVYLNKRGMGYYNKGDHNLAIADFEAALRINPNYDLAKENLNLAKVEYTRQTQSSATIKSTFTDSRDGKIYKTVKIGNQLWMAENLNYNANDSKCYDNKEFNCATYGRLYNWETAMKVCPSGWHLPSKEEWQTLVDFVGGVKVAGKNLKAKSDWDKDGNGMDDFGFTALPGGYGSSDGFGSVGSSGRWWSSSERSSHYAYYRSMHYSYESVDHIYDFKNYLQSVRCLQDNGSTTSDSILTKPAETETTKKVIAKESVSNEQKTVETKHKLSEKENGSFTAVEESPAAELDRLCYKKRNEGYYCGIGQWTSNSKDMALQIAIIHAKGDMASYIRSIVNTEKNSDSNGRIISVTGISVTDSISERITGVRKYFRLNKNGNKMKNSEICKIANIEGKVSLKKISEDSNIVKYYILVNGEVAGSCTYQKGDESHGVSEAELYTVKVGEGVSGIQTQETRTVYDKEKKEYTVYVMVALASE